MRRRVLLVAAAAAGLGGCTTFVGAPQSQALLLVQRASRRAELRGVPFFPQTPYHCGPAALATALVHAGFDVLPEALADTVFLPSRQGALQDEMLAAARSRGAWAVPLPATLAALCDEVAAGHPVVLLQNLGLAVAPRWHYAVAVGFDLDRQHVVLRSGVVERELMDLALFERTWARSGHWAFVALPPSTLPVTAHEEDAVQAAVAFERTATPVQALAAYGSVLRRWPRNLLALLGQGNAHAAQGDTAAAAAAFERAAQLHDSAAAWHNLAVMRLRANDRGGAVHAAQQAFARAQAVERLWLERAQQLVAILAK